MMLRSTSAFLTAFLAILPSLFCANLSWAGEPIRVQDDWGRWVELAAPAERVVALAPNVVENFYSAGAGHKLIAAVSYSDYPEQAKVLPEIGNYKSVSYETLLALKPDLIVAWGSGNGEGMIKKLGDLGFTVFVTEPRTLEDVAHNVRLFGELAGTSDNANRASAQWLKRLAALKHNHSKQAPVSVFYQVWNEPLQTLNGEHLISHVIEGCGGRNTFGDAVVLAPKISIESVLARNPDVIIASGMGESRPDWLNDWNAYPRLKAVKNGNLHHVFPDIIQRHTFRVLSGMEIICETLDEVRLQAGLRH